MASLHYNPSSFDISKINQKPSDYLFEFSNYLIDKKNYKQAYAVLHLIVQRNENFANLHFTLAKCALKCNNTTQAIIHLRKELKHYNNMIASRLLENLQVFNSAPYLTFSLVIVIFVIQFIFFSNPTSIDIYKYALHRDNISFFSTITAFFFHSSYLHLFSNLSLLLIIGSFLEKFISKIQYLILFFIPGLLSNCIQVLFFSDPLKFSIVLGTSGAVFSLLAVVVFKTPLLKINIFTFKVPLLFIILFLYVLSTVTLSNYSTIAHFSHLFGFLLSCAICAIISPILRERFYPLLLFIFGTLLTTSLLLPTVPPILYHPLLDALFALTCILYSYAFMQKKENIIQKHLKLHLDT